MSIVIVSPMKLELGHLVVGGRSEVKLGTGQPNPPFCSSSSCFVHSSIIAEWLWGKCNHNHIIFKRMVYHITVESEWVSSDFCFIAHFLKCFGSNIFLRNFFMFLISSGLFTFSFTLKEIVKFSVIVTWCIL